MSSGLSATRFGFECGIRGRVPSEETAAGFVGRCFRVLLSLNHPSPPGFPPGRKVSSSTVVGQVKQARLWWLRTTHVFPTVHKQDENGAAFRFSSAKIDGTRIRWVASIRHDYHQSLALKDSATTHDCCQSCHDDQFSSQTCV